MTKGIRFILLNCFVDEMLKSKDAESATVKNGLMQSFFGSLNGSITDSKHKQLIFNHVLLMNLILSNQRHDVCRRWS